MTQVQEREYGNVWTLQITNIPSAKSLSDVLLDLKNYAPSIISIERQCDYIRRIPGSTAFISLVTESEKNELLNANTEYNITQENLIFLSLDHSSTVSENREVEEPGSPHSLMIKHLAKEEDPNNYATILYQVLTQCKNYIPQNITGIRFIYNVRKKKLQHFGFLRCLHRRDIYELHNTEVHFGIQEIKFEESKKIPLLIAAVDNNIWGSVYSRAFMLRNQYHIDLEPTIYRIPFVRASDIVPNASSASIAAVESESSNRKRRYDPTLSPAAVDDDIISLGDDLDFNEDDQLIKRAGGGCR